MEITKMMREKVLDRLTSYVRDNKVTVSCLFYIFFIMAGFFTAYFGRYEPGLRFAYLIGAILVIGLWLAFASYLEHLANNLKQENMENIEKFGKGVSSFSLSILAVGVSLVGLTAIAISFIAKSAVFSFILKQLTSLYLLLILLVISGLIAYLIRWYGESIPEHKGVKSKAIDQEKREEIAEWYSIGAGFVLVQVVLIIFIAWGGYNIFYISNCNLELKITEVKPDTPASTVGLKEGSTILMVNNAVINDRDALYKYLLKIKPNDIIVLETNIGSFTIKVTEHPDISGRGYIGIQAENDLLCPRMIF